MTLCIIDPELEATFRAGKAPGRESLLGPKGEPAEWCVTMLTGPVPRLPRHRKFFESAPVPSIASGPASKMEIVGCNIIFKDLRWGYFKLEEAVYAAENGGDGKPVLLINYDVERNGITYRIRDHVRATHDPDVLIGRFHVMLRGRLCFLGYFTLTRIETK